MTGRGITSPAAALPAALVAAALLFACAEERSTRPDAGGAAFSFAETAIAVEEGWSDSDLLNWTTATGLVVLRSNTSDTASVDLYFQDGTATRDTDYRIRVLRVSFPRDEAMKTVPLEIIEDDLAEDDETFRATLGAPSSGRVLPERSRCSVTIVDNDVAGHDGPFYFPLQIGSRWRYRTYSRSTYSPGRIDETPRAVESQTAVDGEVYSKLGSQWFRQEGEAVWFADPVDTTSRYAASRPWRMFDFTAPKGDFWVLYHWDCGPGAVTFDSVSVHSFGRTSVVVPAGVFRNVHHLLFRHILYGDGMCTAPRERLVYIDYFIADSVGIVRERSSSYEWFPTSADDAEGKRLDASSGFSISELIEFTRP